VLDIKRTPVAEDSPAIGD